MSGPTAPRRALAAFVQVVVGLVLGPIAVWALVNGLPVESGRNAVIVAAAVTIVAAVAVFVRFRAARAAAIAFAVGAAATSLLVAAIVAK